MTTPTPTPALRSAIERLEIDAATCEFVKDSVHYYGTDKDQLAADIRTVLAALSAAPAPVEQARGAAEEIDGERNAESLHELRVKRFAAIITKHFQSLATEKGAPNWKDCAEYGWTVIANASGGNWEKESKDWQEAAAKFRTQYYACLDAARAAMGKGDGK